MISLFDVIGPVMIGPSSSHTAGMARIGQAAHAVAPAGLTAIRLSFSPRMKKTYEGHRSHVAAVGGVLGIAEDDPAIREALDVAAGRGIDVQVDFLPECAPQNTLAVCLTGRDGAQVCVTGTSVGGGSIRLLEVTGDVEPTTAEKLMHKVNEQALPSAKEETSVEDAVRRAAHTPGGLAGVAVAYESAYSGADEAPIRKRMGEQWKQMKRSAAAGRQPHTLLFGLADKDDSRRLEQRCREGKTVSGGIVPRAAACALGIMEYNASMGCIVAAPTAGSSGILPGCLTVVQETYGFSDDRMADALLTAALFGVIMDARQVSFSGSIGGCQGEIGVSAALAAVAVASLFTDDPEQIAQAMALCLKNMLGLVCDPIAGPIEVPCIKRNAAGVANAFMAADMALAGISSFIPPDEVIDALVDVERRLPPELKCATVGGLACTKTARRVREEAGF